MKKKKVTKKSKRATKRKVNAKSNDKEVIDKPVYNAISVIISIAIALFLFLSCLGKCGTVGDTIRNALLSAFGTCSYFIPLIFILGAIFNIWKGKNSRLRNYAVIICFLSLICMLQLIINDRPDGEELVETITRYIDVAKEEFSFENGHFSGGAVGVVIAESLARFFGTNGTLIVIVALFVISLLLFTGVSIYGKIISGILLIITFIPRKISQIAENSKIDENIADENEAIFNEMMQDKIRPLAGKEIENEKEKELLEPLEIKNDENTYSTENIDIDPSIVQKRFFNEEQEIENRTGMQKTLLDEMKKKSVNEIVYENSQVKPDDFFYENEVSDERKEAREEERLNGYNYSDNSNSNDNDNEQGQDNYEKEDILKKDTTFVNDIEENKIKLSEALDEASEMQDLSDHTEEHAYNNEINAKEASTKSQLKRKAYKFPPIDILERNKSRNILDKDLTKDTANILKSTLEQFGVGVAVTDVSVGPTVTRYELQPNIGVKVSKVLGLQDDIKLALAASEIRIEAPIPGKSAIGIEVPNKNKISVLLGDLIASREFKEQKGMLTAALGKDISGKNIYIDISKMPHMLIAGATGSGKSVCINTIIMSLIYKTSPKDVRMILIDPKVVELQSYKDIPHLLTPVVTDPKKAKHALQWAVSEMTRRYKVFAEKQVKDLDGYNELIDIENKNAIYENSNEEHMPKIVIIIDELADLMMEAGKEVEASIVRLAQLSRACGIHLVIATQRPSVNVVTGLIKANVPSRIAFAVSSGVDSRTIIDMNGAEDLLGNGDMLFFPTGYPKPVRMQGCFVSEKEIKNTVNFVKDTESVYDESIIKEQNIVGNDGNGGGSSNGRDELFVEAGILCIKMGQASIGNFQRKFMIGFNRAARIMDQLEEAGVVSPQDGKKPREALMTIEEFNNKFS